MKMTRLDKTFIGAISAAVFVLFAGLAFSTYQSVSEASEVRSQCEDTDLYVIGDKGHRNRVYDCSGVNGLGR